MTAARILHVRDSRLVGSPEKLIIGQFKHLRYCYDIYLCTYYKSPDLTSRLASAGIKTLNLPFNRFNPLSTILALRNIISRYRINLVCTHDYKSNFFGLICAKLCKIPALSIFHGRTSHDFKIRCYETLDNFVLRRFDKVIAVCEASKRKLVALGIPEAKVEVIFNAVQTPKKRSKAARKGIRNKIGIKKGDFLAAFIGRLSREKGVEYLVDAVKITVDKSSSTVPRLLIIGDGKDFARLQEKITRHGLNDYITLTGYQNDINELYEEIDLVVLPSLTEGMPLAVLEAFAHKKPVIASNVGGIPELIKDHESGFLVNKADPAELSEKLLYCMKNREHLKLIGEKGFYSFTNIFTFEHQSKELKRVYDFLIN